MYSRHCDFLISALPDAFPFSFPESDLNIQAQCDKNFIYCCFFKNPNPADVFMTTNVFQKVQDNFNYYFLSFSSGLMPWRSPTLAAFLPFPGPSMAPSWPERAGTATSSLPTWWNNTGSGKTLKLP